MLKSLAVNFCFVKILNTLQELASEIVRAASRPLAAAFTLFEDFIIWRNWIENWHAKIMSNCNKTRWHLTCTHCIHMLVKNETGMFMFVAIFWRRRRRQCKDCINSCRSNSLFYHFLVFEVFCIWKNSEHIFGFIISNEVTLIFRVFNRQTIKVSTLVF